MGFSLPFFDTTEVVKGLGIIRVGSFFWKLKFIKFDIEGIEMKDWWQDFFIPVTGEIMFQPRKEQSVLEVSEVIKKAKTRKSAKVLDLACGVGRHSVVFSQKGFDVVGLDFSKNYLSEAKKSALKSKLKVKFVCGNMKNLKPHFDEQSFDLVVSLYNSFGYFKSRSEDLKMLKEVFRVLKPGGKFVINTLNGSGVKRAIKKPISIGREPIKNVFMIDAAKFDHKKNQTRSQWTIIDARKTKAKVHRMSFQQNVYSHEQLKVALRKAGFKIETTWGLLQGGAFDPSKTWHQTVVARKQTINLEFSKMKRVFMHKGSCRSVPDRYF